MVCWDDLNGIAHFPTNTGLRQFVCAARDLGVGLAVVSKRLASLERRAGQRLVNRTTRKLSPTKRRACTAASCRSHAGRIGGGRNAYGQWLGGAAWIAAA